LGSGARLADLNDLAFSALLVIRTGALRCAVPVDHVLETMRPLPVRSLACAPGFVLGAAVIRGEPVPVVDLASLLSAPSAAVARFVLLQAGSHKVALAVESVTGVQVLAPHSVSNLPPLLAGLQAGAVAAIGALDKDLLLVLETARLVPDDVWASLPGPEAS